MFLAITSESFSGLSKGSLGPNPHTRFEWEYEDGELTVRNDRYGFFPAFYGKHDGKLAISTSIDEILQAGIPSELDVDALSVFLRIGYYLGEDTPFRYIRAFPPGCTLKWSNGKVSLCSSFPRFQRNRLSRRAALDGLVQTFRKSIRKRLPARKFVVPLSGGRDSRHILFELCHQGIPPDLAVTVEHFPPKADEDARVAKLVASATGVSHVLLKQRSNRFAADRATIPFLNYCADEHAWIWPLAHFLKDTYSETYDGLAGDVLTSGFYQTPERLKLLRKGRIREFAESMGLGDGRLAILAGEFPKERAYRRFDEEIEKHFSQPRPIASFTFFNRTRREIALGPFRMLNTLGPTVHCPFMDIELVELLMGLEPPIIWGRHLHTDAIAAAYPQYAGIPYEDKSLQQAGLLSYIVAALHCLWHLPFSRSVAKIPALARLALHCLDPEVNEIANTIAYADLLSRATASMQFRNLIDNSHGISQSGSSLS